MPVYQYRKGYAYNLMNFAGLCLSVTRLLFIIIVFPQEYSFWDIVLNALPAVCCLLMMLWMGLRRNTLTRLFSFLVFPFLLFYIGTEIHDRGVVAYFIPYLIYPFFFLNRPWKILVAFLVAAGFFAASYLVEVFHVFHPTHAHNPPLEIISMCGSLVLTFISLSSIKFQIWGYEQAMLNQAKELEARSESIRRQNEVMTQQKERLEESNRTKDKLFSLISHDLRVPIQGLQLLFASEENSEEALVKLGENLPELRAELKKTSDLFENLLNWAKLQMQDTVVSPQKVDLEEVAAEVREHLLLKASRKGVLIDLDFRDRYVYSDEHVMEIVLRNLLSNAIKFSEKDDTVTIRGRRVNEQYILEVEDQGVGIDRLHLEKIQHKSFYTSSGTKNEKGTGLGLIICKDLVEKCGGELMITSHKGEGTVVTVSLPQEPM